MKKFLLVIFLISVLASGLFATETDIDTTRLEEISWEEIGEDAVILEVVDDGIIVIEDGKCYIVDEN